MTELEAINSLLTRLGERPLNSLEGQLNADAKLARNVLSETSKDVQLYGFHFNTEEDVEWEPVDDEIDLATTILRFTIDTKKHNRPYPVQRGTRLFNRSDNTYTFDDTVYVAELIRYLDWDYLPPVAQDYIAAKAGRKFVASAKGTPELVGEANADEIMARVTLLQQESDATDANWFSDHWEMVQADGWRF